MYISFLLFEFCLQFFFLLLFVNVTRKLPSRRSKLNVYVSGFRVLVLDFGFVEFGRQNYELTGLGRRFVRRFYSSKIQRGTSANSNDVKMSLQYDLIVSFLCLTRLGEPAHRAVLGTSLARSSRISDAFQFQNWKVRVESIFQSWLPPGCLETCGKVDSKCLASSTADLLCGCAARVPHRRVFSLRVHGPVLWKVFQPIIGVQNCIVIYALAQYAD